MRHSKPVTHEEQILFTRFETREQATCVLREFYGHLVVFGGIRIRPGFRAELAAPEPVCREIQGDPLEEGTGRIRAAADSADEAPEGLGDEIVGIFAIDPAQHEEAP